MELKYIEAFLKIKEKGSFSSAADALFITQSTISTRIKRLEKEIDTVLFKRNSGKTVELTSEGEKIYPLLKEAYGMIHSAISSVQNIDKSLRTFRISCPVHMADHFVPHMSNMLYEDFPEYDISLKINNSSKTIESVHNGKYDIGFAYFENPKIDSNVIIRHIADAKTVIVCAPDHSLINKNPLTLNDLKTDRIIVYGKALVTYVIISKYLKNQGIANDLNMIEVQNLEWMKKMAKERQGIAMMQEVVVREDLRNKTLCELMVDPSLPPTPIYMVYKKEIPPKLLAAITVSAKQLFQPAPTF